MLFAVAAIKTGFVFSWSQVKKVEKTRAVVPASDTLDDCVPAKPFSISSSQSTQGATDSAVAFYTARGWQRWRGPSWALTPSGVVRTAEEDGAIYVLPIPGGAALSLDDPLMADWREGDVW